MRKRLPFLLVTDVRTNKIKERRPIRDDGEEITDAREERKIMKKGLLTREKQSQQ